MTFIRSARADETSHRKLAEELLTRMDVHKNVERMFESVKKAQMAQFKKMNVPQEASDKIQSMQNEMMDLMAQEMSWDKVKQDYISVFADKFAEEELKEIIGFYKSPVGQKFIKDSPELMKKLMEISQRQMGKIMPKIQAIRKAMAEELKATQKDKPQEK
jgi:hypothetical protein